jgi:hypothetical protein
MAILMIQKKCYVVITVWLSDTKYVEALGIYSHIWITFLRCIKAGWKNLITVTFLNSDKNKSTSTKKNDDPNWAGWLLKGKFLHCKSVEKCTQRLEWLGKPYALFSSSMAESKQFTIITAKSEYFYTIWGQNYKILYKGLISYHIISYIIY